MGKACDAGCKIFDGGERKHVKTCPNYQGSLSEIMDSQAKRIEHLERHLEVILNKSHMQPRNDEWCSHSAWFDRALNECQAIAANALAENNK